MVCDETQRKLYGIAVSQQLMTSQGIVKNNRGPTCNYTRINSGVGNQLYDGVGEVCYNRNVIYTNQHSGVGNSFQEKCTGGC